MDHPSFKSFSAKLLLFGEHTVVHGSKALAIPYSAMHMQFEFLKENNEFYIHLVNLHNYLIKLTNLHYRYDLDRFARDISSGLNIISTIPIGYGAGSSGALVACFFDAYCENFDQHIDNLKKDLAAIESHFHGRSSGIDPLVSYLNCPILIEGGKVEILEKISFRQENLFILDSGLARSTEQYVERFKSKIADEIFAQAIKEHLVPLNNGAIHNYIFNESIWQNFVQISKWQLANMLEFIPAEIQKLWREGLDSGDFALKLCGAGGGGFFLGLRKEHIQLDLDKSHPVRFLN